MTVSESQVTEELTRAKLDNQQLAARIAAMGDGISRYYGEIAKAPCVLKERDAVISVQKARVVNQQGLIVQGNSHVDDRYIL